MVKGVAWTHLAQNSHCRSFVKKGNETLGATKGKGILEQPANYKCSKKCIFRISY
jgi:hypothetical protein